MQKNNKTTISLSKYAKENNFKTPSISLSDYAKKNNFNEKEDEVVEIKRPLGKKVLDYFNTLVFRGARDLNNAGDTLIKNVANAATWQDKLLYDSNKEIANKIKEKGNEEFANLFEDTNKYHKSAIDLYNAVPYQSQYTKNMDTLATQSEEKLREGNSKLGNVLTDIALAGGDMGIKGLETFATGIPLPVIMGLQSGAGEYQNAIKEGKDDKKALELGLGSGLISGGIESISGIGASQFSKALGSEVGQSILNKVPSKVGNYLSKASNSILGKILKSGAGEAFEEGLEYDVQRIYRNLLLDENTPRDVKEQAYNMLIGGAVGGLFGSGKAVMDKISSKSNKASVDTMMQDDISQNKPLKNENSIISQEEIKTPQKSKIETNNSIDVDIDSKIDYNPVKEKVIQEYNEAIETIQNHYGTNELRIDEVEGLKDNLGIDLDDILSRWDQAEKLDNMSSKERFEYLDKTGVADYYYGEDIANQYRQKYNSEKGANLEETNNQPYKDLGADTYNPETYENKVMEYGAIPEGENPSRIVDVPQQVNDDTKVNRFVRTAMESDVVTDEMIPELENEIVNGKFNYEPTTNKQTLENVNNDINRNGYDNTLKAFKAKIESGEQLNVNDIATGERLIQMAIQNGDSQTAYDLIIDVAQAGTELGKAVQALRILKRLSPEGQLKILDRQAKKLGKKYNKDIEIDANLVNELLTSTNEKARTKTIDKIKNNIASQLPSSWVDKWNAWRYLSMLGNPKTHIRNILGNAIFYPVRQFKNIIGTALEKTLPQADRTKSILTKKDDALREYARNDFDSAKEVISGETKYSTGGGIETKKQVFKLKPLEYLRNLNFDLLELEDNLFLKNVYVESFAQAMKAKGVSAEYLNSPEGQKTLNSIREYATIEAKKATYRDDSKIASDINKRKNTNKATKIIGEGIIPFTKTPINIIKRGTEYSPIGLVKAAKEGFVDVKNGTKTASQALDSLASGLSGSAVMLLGMWLSSKGFISGGDKDDNKEQAFNEMQGLQNYALKLGNYTYTIDWTAPVALPFFVGVEAYNALKDNYSLTEIIDATSKITEPVFELSMLQGINNSIKTAGYSERPITDILKNSASSYVSQAAPTLLGQIARTIDNQDSRSTYVDKNSQVPKLVQSTLQKAQNKIPFANQKLQPRLDNWGRSKEKSTAKDYLISAFENFLSPGYLEKVNTTNVDKELQRLYDKIGESVFPSNIQKYLKYNGETKNLTAEEYTKYKRAKGQAAFEMIDDVIKDKSYTKLSDTDKAKVINKIYDYVNAVAKTKVSDYKLEGEYLKIKQAEDKGINASDYILYKVSLPDNYKQEEFLSYLNKTNFTKNQKSFLFSQRYTSDKNNPFK